MLMRSGEKKTEFTCLFRVLSTYNARFVTFFGDPARTNATTNSESRDERKEQGETDTKNKDLNLKRMNAFVNDVDI